jgi:hypothetical protein
MLLQQRPHFLERVVTYHTSTLLLLKFRTAPFLFMKFENTNFELIQISKISPSHWPISKTEFFTRCSKLFLSRFFHFIFITFSHFRSVKQKNSRGRLKILFFHLIKLYKFLLPKTNYVPRT